jgi:hypothetical protein
MAWRDFRGQGRAVEQSFCTEKRSGDFQQKQQCCSGQREKDVWFSFCQRKDNEPVFAKQHICFAFRSKEGYVGLSVRENI